MAKRQWVSAAVMAGVLCAAGAARAALVTGNFTATITSESGDIAALFGAPSIMGDTMTGTFRYDTSVFPAPNSCSAGCAFWDTTDGSLPAGVVSVTETVNGATFVFSGYYFGALLLGNSSVPGGWAYGANSSGWVQTFQLSSDNNSAYGPGWDATQLNLGMFDQSAQLVDAALDPAGPFNFGVAQSQSNGSNWADARGAASWGFQLTTAAVDAPEPGSLGMFAAGMAGLGWLRWRQR